MDIDSLSDASFWVDRWNAFLNDLPHQASNFDSPEIWDRMAKNYKCNEVNDQATRDNERDLVEKLIKQGIVFPGAKVLDLGCGPGNFATLFAEAGADVVALDISTAMLNRLQQEVPTELSKKVHPVNANWLEIDLDSAGYSHRFDLVFANMTPAVSRPDGFLKLIKASKKWCLNATWVGERKNNPLDLLTKQIFGEKQPYRSKYFPFALNLLLSDGYLPLTDFQKTAWEKDEKLEDVYTHYLDFFKRQKNGAVKNLERSIRHFLERRVKDGLIRKSSSGTIGRLLWRVDRKESDGIY